MVAGLEPLRKARRGLLDRIGRGDADGVEAKRRRPRDQRVFESLRRRVGLLQRSERGQKSGSA
jgi:hypothetical protein